MFKIEYETPTKTGWLSTEYTYPEDADYLARRLIQTGQGEILRATVVEQAGHVYSEWVWK